MLLSSDINGQNRNGVVLWSCLEKSLLCFFSQEQRSYRYESERDHLLLNEEHHEGNTVFSNIGEKPVVEDCY